MRHLNVTFAEEPTLDDLALDGAGLTIRLVDPTDAQEAHDLLNHPDLEHLDPDFAPAEPANYAAFATTIQTRGFNSEGFRRYQWAVRLTESHSLVGLVTAELKAVAPGYRTAELTAYFHPDHQGKGYFSASSRRILGFTHRRFLLTHQRAMIHWTNNEVAAMAAASGLEKQPGQTIQGYETWIAPLPGLPEGPAPAGAA